MKFWFLTDSNRVGVEKRAVEELATTEPWLAVQRWRLHLFRLACECVITAHGIEYPVRLVFPDQFPAVPAWVEPQDPQAKWSRHQYGAGGALCLELRPDNWVASATGADVLRSAYNLLHSENPLGAAGEKGSVPSADSVGEVQAYMWDQPALLGTGLLERLRTGSASNVRGLIWQVLDKLVRMYVYDDVDAAEGRRPPTGAAGFIDVPVYWTSHEGTWETVPSRAELATAYQGETADEILRAPFAIAVVVSDASVQVFQLIEGFEPARRNVSVLRDQTGVRSGSARELRDKKVAVVGAGSIGSKLIESLVRSGVRKVRIVDGDVFLPGNLERHVLDWRDVALRKAASLKRRIAMIAADAEVEVFEHNLNWQRSAETHAWQIETVSDCDIIVDATGDIPTAFFLGALAARNQVPFVSSVVFEGGLGALVSCCVPGRDPTYAVARAAFQTWCEEQDKEVPATTGRRYEALDDDGDPIVADDSTVTITAGFTARVALDCLEGRPPPHEHAWMLIGLRAGWVFNGLGHVVKLALSAPPASASLPPDEEAQKFAAQLTQEALDAHKSRE